MRKKRRGKLNKEGNKQKKKLGKKKEKEMRVFSRAQ